MVIVRVQKISLFSQTVIGSFDAFIVHHFLLDLQGEALGSELANFGFRLDLFVNSWGELLLKPEFLLQL